MNVRSIPKGVFVAAAVAVLTAACNREPAAPIDQRATMAVDDERLATYVQARYQADSSIRASDIRVSATNGVVTLRGSVPSESVREHAATLARDVSGVQTIDNQIQVVRPPADEPAPTSSRPMARSPIAERRPLDPASPGWITTKIQAQYFVNPEVRPFSIDVTTSSDGVVTLRGEVDETVDSDEAVRIARDTDGVARVDNQLRVRSAASERAGAEGRDSSVAERDLRADESPDAWITAKVQAKYFLDTDVKGRNINVDTRDGIVTLTGEVENEGERRQAVAIARNTDGVQSVTDQLQVQQTDRVVPTDEDLQARRDAPLGVDDVWITTKVQAKFFLEDDIKARDINVDVRDGVVYLKGAVESEEQRTLAERIARDTDGVARVQNLLTVDSTTLRR